MSFRTSVAARQKFKQQFAALGCAALFVALMAAGAEEAAKSRATQSAKPVPAPRDAKTALGEFNSLIGEWRGVGQPRRGSSDGAWSEKGEWIWDFSKDKNKRIDSGKEAVAIHYEVKDGKLLNSAALTWDAKSETYKLNATLPDKSLREYAGKLADGRLLLETQPDAAGETHRLTVTRLNEKRTLVLFETRRKGSTMFGRVAEIGYTREGTRLAAEGAGGIECVVTGGKGTIKVSYKGQTYYVCCTGCKQAFDDDPEGVLAEYKKRLEERKKK